MCTNFTPTNRTDWVKHNFDVALPSSFPEESYPGFAAPLVVKSHQTNRVACGLARFGLIPSWAKDDKISRHTYSGSVFAWFIACFIYRADYLQVGDVLLNGRNLESLVTGRLIHKCHATGQCEVCERV